MRIPIWAALALVGRLMIPVAGHAQELPEWLLALKLPNSGAKSIMTPSAWGAAYGAVYLGAGAAERTPYLTSADGILGMGYGLGDPILTAGLQLGTTVSDLSEFGNVSFSFKIHRYLAKGTTIALGAESLLSNNEFADDAGSTFYLVASHVLQSLGSNRPGIGRVHVSAGVGTGRFANKSGRDFAEGKGSTGTIAFGNVAIEVVRDVNVIVEWSGTNLIAGMSTTMRLMTMPIAFSIGLADLTGYSGDGARLVAGGAVALSL